MSLPKYKELDSLTNVVDIENEIFLLQKNLFDLKLKKFTSQNVKPHLFTHTKHRLAQLQFKKSGLIKKET
jgi:large subunit ribosomal protein L29